MRNRVFLLSAPYKFEVEERELPPPEAEYSTLQYLYCGICGGDYSSYIGRRRGYPLILGHEFVAKVIQTGEKSHFQQGDIVVSDFNYRCEECNFCKSRQSHLCVHREIGLFSNRGFAQYANVHEKYLFLVSHEDWLPRACVIEPLSCVIHACTMMGIQKKHKVLLVGGGSIGSMFAFYLSQCIGCQSIEVMERIEERARNLSKCFTIECSFEENGSYDYVIDCSNDPIGVKIALKATPSGGNICIMSHLYGLNTSFIYEEICKRELRAFFPLRNGDVSNLKTAIACMDTHWKKDYDRLIHVYTDLEVAFSEKEYSPWNKQVIQLF